MDWAVKSWSCFLYISSKHKLLLNSPVQIAFILKILIQINPLILASRLSHPVWKNSCPKSTSRTKARKRSSRWGYAGYVWVIIFHAHVMNYNLIINASLQGTQKLSKHDRDWGQSQLRQTSQISENLRSVLLLSQGNNLAPYLSSNIIKWLLLSCV